MQQNLTEATRCHVSQSPWVIAHRGASSECPENSLAAFRRAIELGVQALEVDVHLSADGVPVCRHNCALPPDCALLADLTVQQLQGRAPESEKIPTLEQLLGLDRRQIELFIELKAEGCRDPKRLVAAVLELVDHYRGFRMPLPFIGSFSAAMLRELAAAGWPRARTVAVAEYPMDLERLLAFDPTVLAVCVGMVSAERVADWCRAKRAVWVWTVDDVAATQRLLALGVGGVITNDPRALLPLRQGFPVKNTQRLGADCHLACFAPHP